MGTPRHSGVSLGAQPGRSDIRPDTTAMPLPVRASLWCAHPRMKPGEAFSSWLHRSAYANGMADHTYCRHVFGNKAVWNRDVDHLADVDMLAAAARSTGERSDRLAKSTLRAYQGVLFDQLDVGGHFPWVLSLGIYHRMRKRHGQQFCPQCLSQGPAWMRLRWRLAWSVCCPDHGCYLRDACPHCDAPLIFHRLSLSTPGRLPCHACSANLASVSGTNPANQRTLRFERRLGRALAGDPYQLPGVRIEARALFEGLRVLARGVFCKQRLAGLEDTLPSCRRRLRPVRPPMNIEHWRLPARIFTLDVLRRAVADWPSTFIEQARHARIYRARFEGRRGEILPEWVSAGLDGLRHR